MPKSSSCYRPCIGRYQHVQPVSWRQDITLRPVRISSGSTGRRPAGGIALPPLISGAQRRRLSTPQGRRRISSESRRSRRSQNAPPIAPKWRRSLLITGAALWAAQADQEAAALRDSAIGPVDYLFKASLRAFAGVKVSFLEAAIFIVSPVAGFRPSRAGDAFTLKSGREEVGH